MAERLSVSSRGFRVLNALGLPRGDLSQTVVVAGSPRSGTTWLAELLATLPGFTLVDEPLHLRWPAVRQAGFTERRTYIAPSAESPAARAYLEEALAGRAACDRQFGADSQIDKLWTLLASTKNIVKFVRANRMLHWMDNQFATRGMILVLRHPCAVIASQLDYKNGGWRREKPVEIGDVQTEFGWIPHDVAERFEPVLADIRSNAGRLAAVWCLDAYFPLREEGAFPGLITTYERLLTQETKEVRRIFQSLGEPVPERALGRFDEASYSASSDLVTEDIRHQLSKWKDKLSADQISEILSVVGSFGLDFYTDALEPNYARLDALAEDGTTEAVNTHGQAKAI